MQSIKVMTWNVWNEEKADNILTLIKKIDPDIACCQELTQDSIFNPGRNIPQEIAKLMNANFEYQHSMSDVNDNTGEFIDFGNAIFSKFPIKQKRHVYVEQPGPLNSKGRRTNRVYVELTLDINGRSLRVGTVHLTFVPHLITTAKKLDEAEELYKAIKQNSKNFILTGDMNSLPSSAIIKELSRRLKNAGPDFSEQTWTSKPAVYGDWHVNGLNWRLDYIFTSQDVNVLSSKIIKTDFSDHLPIVAEVKI